MMRNMIGYGEYGSSTRWPHGAKIAINFVINYEEGAERSPLYGDDIAENYGGEFPLAVPPPTYRSLSMESFFEYGSRTGLWRLIRLFDRHSLPITFFICGSALEQNPAFASYLHKTEHEVAGHGWRWIDYSNIDHNDEKKHIKQCVDTIDKLTGQRPVGWYTGRRSMQTRQLLIEHGGFLYDSDSYSDDCPYFENEHLVIPYSLVTNDFRYITNPGFSSPNDFYQLLTNTFDMLYQEDRGNIMNIGLHPRISGHPGRSVVIQRFIEYIQRVPNVWIAKRKDIAEHWAKYGSSA